MQRQGEDLGEEGAGDCLVGDLETNHTIAMDDGVYLATDALQESLHQLQQQNLDAAWLMRSRAFFLLNTSKQQKILHEWKTVVSQNLNTDQCVLLSGRTNTLVGFMDVLACLLPSKKSKIESITRLLSLFVLDDLECSAERCHSGLYLRMKAITRLPNDDIVFDVDKFDAFGFNKVILELLSVHKRYLLCDHDKGLLKFHPSVLFGALSPKVLHDDSTTLLTLLTDAGGFAQEEAYSVLQLLVCIRELLAGNDVSSADSGMHAEEQLHMSLGVTASQLHALVSERYLYVRHGQDQIRIPLSQAQVVERLKGLAIELFSGLVHNIVHRVGRSLRSNTCPSHHSTVLTQSASLHILSNLSSISSHNLDGGEHHVEVLARNFAEDRLQQALAEHGHATLEQHNTPYSALDDHEQLVLEHSLALECALTALDTITTSVGLVSAAVTSKGSSDDDLLCRKIDDCFSRRLTRGLVHSVAVEDENSNVSAETRVSHQGLPCAVTKQFSVQHSFGTLQYTVDGWVEANRMSYDHDIAVQLAQMSSNSFLRSLFGVDIAEEVCSIEKHRVIKHESAPADSSSKAVDHFNSVHPYHQVIARSYATAFVTGVKHVVKKVLSQCPESPWHLVFVGNDIVPSQHSGINFFLARRMISDQPCMEVAHTPSTFQHLFDIVFKVEIISIVQSDSSRMSLRDWVLVSEQASGCCALAAQKRVTIASRVSMPLSHLNLEIYATPQRVVCSQTTFQSLLRLRAEVQKAAASKVARTWRSFCKRRPIITIPGIDSCGIMDERNLANAGTMSLNTQNSYLNSKCLHSLHSSMQSLMRHYAEFVRDVLTLALYIVARVFGPDCDVMSLDYLDSRDQHIEAAKKDARDAFVDLTLYSCLAVVIFLVSLVRASHLFMFL